MRIPSSRVKIDCDSIIEMTTFFSWIREFIIQKANSKGLLEATIFRTTKTTTRRVCRLRGQHEVENDETFNKN